MTRIHQRPLDLVLVGFFAISIAYGFLFSLPEGLGVPVTPDSPWPPLRALHGWAVAEEPAHLNPPANLIAACLFAGLFQAPVLLFVVFGLVTQRPWLRPLGLVYAGAAVTNMFFYFSEIRNDARLLRFSLRCGVGWRRCGVPWTPPIELCEEILRHPSLRYRPRVAVPVLVRPSRVVAVGDLNARVS